FLSHRALEKAISIERSTPLPLEAPDCFKVRWLEKNWAELTKDGRGEGITPLEHLANHLKRVTLNQIACSNMEGLSATKKGIMVQAILDVANMTLLHN
ncbi:27420_t:CDS:2, partial [Dentiscutata erythropus]